MIFYKRFIAILPDEVKYKSTQYFESKKIQVKNGDESDALLSTTFGECGKIGEMSGHMYSLACRMVLSDLPADVAFRKNDKKLQGEQSSDLIIVLKGLV